MRDQAVHLDPRLDRLRAVINIIEHCHCRSIQHLVDHQNHDIVEGIKGFPLIKQTMPKGLACSGSNQKDESKSQEKDVKGTSISSGHGM